jgi:transposase InsO family protein
MSSFPKALQDQIKAMRGNHEGWGPTTILAELQLDKKWVTTKLPSRSVIGSFLKQEGLSRSYEPNSPLPVPACKKARRCHGLWQIDGQGNSQVGGIGAVAMLNAKDVHSSLYAAVFPARMKSMQGHPNTSDYQTAMRLGFIHHGLPRRVQSDHASVFYENKSKSPFPTLFCLWLISLGIQPCFSRVNRPTDQGTVERAHQTVFNQVLRRKDGFKNWEHLFECCQKRRQRLNGFIPSTATDNLPPLKKYPQAKHSGRFYHLHREAQMISLKRVWAFLSKGKWYRQVAGNRTVCLGGQVYYIPGAKPKEQLIITFCNRKKQLLFQNDKELVIHQIPIKGITVESLMGNLEQFALFPALQLELPFEWEAQKINTTFSDSA